MVVISEYAFLHMLGVEAEFPVILKFRGQWRPLRSSNELKMEVIEVMVMFLVVLHHIHPMLSNFMFSCVKGVF